jgi:3-deoxy-D-manno-octulosonic-acid transferase
MAMSMRVYQRLAGAAAPALRVWLEHRARRGKEDARRLGEREGHASAPRPRGPLLWIHGASLGETRSALPLLRAIIAERPHAAVLFTTGTVTSAKFLEENLPERTRHQYLPLDVPAWIERFIAHWRPDAALWIESELWPTTLATIAARRIPTALVNARLSPRAFRRWSKLAALVTPPLAAFDMVLAQSDGDAERFAALGARDVCALGNLKFDSAYLPADIAALGELGAMIGSRPLWLAASIHPREDAIITKAHRRIVEHHPELLTIVVPRHAARGDAMADSWRGEGLVVAQRSRNQPIEARTAIYLADTMGELGLFYRLSPIAFIGKSLAESGGQNPLEAAALGCAILSGPWVENFAAIFATLRERGAAQIIGDPPRRTLHWMELAGHVAEILDDADLRQRMAQAATDVAAEGRGATARVLAALQPILAALDRGGDDARA